MSRGLSLSFVGVLLLLNGCAGHVDGVTYYHAEKESTASSTMQPNMVVLDNGLVEEYPRAQFDAVYGSNLGFSTAIRDSLRQRLNLSEGQIQLLSDKEQVDQFKASLRAYFGDVNVNEPAHPSTEPLKLPVSLTSLKQPLWVVTDWEYNVSSHESGGTMHQAPGGAPLGVHEYGYYNLVLYGVLIDQQGHVIRYNSSRGQKKYIRTVEKLPLDRLLNEALDGFTALMAGKQVQQVSLKLPRSYYRR